MNEILQQQIGSDLKKARLEKGMTAEQVSKKSKINRTATIYDIEAGKGNPNLSTLMKIAKAVGCEIKITGK